MAEPDGELLRCSDVWDLREVFPVFRNAAQHGIHQTCGTGAGAFRLFDRFVDRRRHGYFIHKQELADTEPENIQKVRLKLCGRNAGIAADVIITERRVLQHVQTELCAERRVALIQRKLFRRRLDRLLRPGVKPPAAGEDIQRRLAGARRAVSHQPSSGGRAERPLRSCASSLPPVSR